MSDYRVGEFASAKGYFRKVGDWVSDQELCGFSCGKISAIDSQGVTLEFAAGNTVTLGEGLLNRSLKWEIESWQKMKGLQSSADSVR